MFPLPLTLVAAPSKALRNGLLGMHAIGLVALWLSDLTTHLQAMLGLLLLASGTWRLRTPHSLTLAFHRDGQFAIQMHGARLPSALGLQQAILPWIVVLRYRLGDRGRTRQHLLLPDCLPDQDLRRLRVWLKWRARKGRMFGGIDTKREP
ncbi:MAG: hypothetical protein H6935_10925 [Thiobacillus sp.]|nr:hypothetical protein [Thiobacillus sp.]